MGVAIIIGVVSLKGVGVISKRVGVVSKNGIWSFTESGYSIAIRIVGVVIN